MKIIKNHKQEKLGKIPKISSHAKKIPRIFSMKKVHDARKEEELRASLYQQIGQLKVELDWMKKKVGLNG